MTVLDRSELQASPLADLHLIADQIGLESFRRLRKADLIDAILAQQGGGEREAEDAGAPEEGSRAARPRRTRARSRRGRERPAADAEVAEAHEPEGDERPAERMADGVVEVLGNGSAFLRVQPPDSSDQDVYISAAQVRRCELVSGDRVSGPVRSPRRSERYPSLIRVQTINGQPASQAGQGARYEDLGAAWPSERIAFDSEDATLKAIEWLTPLGLGSRALIVGAARSGKTEALRRIAAALAGRDGLELTLVLAGARPEEIEEWRSGPLAPQAALGFAASPDAQGQAVEGAVESAKRLAARGAHAIVLIDGLDGVHPHTARKVLAAARNIPGGGSLTLIATAARPFGGETTVIALDGARAGTGRFPALDLPASGTLRAELLVGEHGAEEIARARAAAL